ncbi:hypothetical protein Bca52824_044172 [Brassica carinata]|uniref:Uncharacterized protein n=1 Tax=Brassica carinata TaxID=52824 RepID=A0A8X7RXW7_BRACI|nr:hypothetical protein Bca52824_044172 [Brassica carinata]
MIRNSHNNGLKVHTWLQDDILKETSRLTPSDTSCGESDPSDITTLISKHTLEQMKQKLEDIRMSQLLHLIRLPKMKKLY